MRTARLGPAPITKQAKPRKVEISAGGGKATATATAIDASSSGS